MCPQNATYMPHIQISTCVDIRQLCHYIYLLCTHCNQLWHHKHCYTYISHYWHMPLNIYSCHIRHVFSTVLVICSLHVDPTVQQIYVKQNNKLQLYLSCYKHIYVINIYATQMPHICQICQLLHVQI